MKSKKYCILKKFSNEKKNMKEAIEKQIHKKANEEIITLLKDPLPLPFKEKKDVYLPPVNPIKENRHETQDEYFERIWRETILEFRLTNFP